MAKAASARNNDVAAGVADAVGGWSVPTGDIDENGTAGKYQLRAIIGRGAAGVVYEGWDPVLARKVAVKTLPLAGKDDESREQYTRFQQEAQAAGRLHHPNIVAVFDYGETPTHAYIVMELLPGGSLRERLGQGRFSVADAMRTMQGLLAGLQHSHANGVVHRDVKPANVVYTDTNEVKITDFGIARLESSQITAVGSVLGTPAYMSPEQVMGETADARSDIYSAGVILFELLTGQRLFEGTANSIMHKIVSAEAPRPSGLPAQVPAHFDAIIARAMAKDPKARFPSAEDFARALRQEEDLTLPLQRDQPRRDPLATSGGTRAARPELSTASSLRPPQGSAAQPPPASAVQPAPVSPPPAPRPPRGGFSRMLGIAGLVVVVAGAGLGWSMFHGTMKPDAGPGPGPGPGPGTVTGAGTPPIATVDPPPPANPPAQSPLPPTPEPAPPTPIPAEPPPTPRAPDIPPRDASTSVPVTPPPRPAPPEQTPQPLPRASGGSAPDPAALRSQIAGALAAMPCSVLRGEAHADNSVAVSGVTALDGAAGPAAEAALRDALSRVAGFAGVEMDVQRIAGPFCGAFDILRSAAYGTTAVDTPVRLALASDATALSIGGGLRLSATMPDFPASLRVDRFSADGTVSHLAVPMIGAPLAGAGGVVPLAANAATASAWVISPGEGASVVVAIATAAPLSLARRPPREAASGYLADLASALAAARDAGGKLSVSVLPLGSGTGR